MTGRVRRAGGRWRLLAHDALPHGVDGQPHHVKIPGTEFDELVVGRWIHIEQMDTGFWWMNIGGVTVHVKADRDGRPTAVTVHGPEDYASPVEGCTYELVWRERAS